MEENKIHIDNFFKNKIKNQDPVNAVPDFNALFSSGIAIENTTSDNLIKSNAATASKVFSVSTLTITAGITLVIGFILGFYTAGEIIKKEQKNEPIPFEEQKETILKIKKESKSFIDDIKKETQENNTGSEIKSPSASTSTIIPTNKEATELSESIGIDENTNRAVNKISPVNSETTEEKVKPKTILTDTEVEAVPEEKNKAETNVIPETEKESIPKENTSIKVEKSPEKEMPGSEDSEEGIDLFIK